MWIVFLFAVIVGFYSFQNICFKQFNRLYMKGMDSYFMFSALYFALICCIFLVMGVDLSQFNLPLIALGTMFAVSFVGAIFFYMKAMEHGPLGLSFLFFSAGMLLPIAFGIVVYNEPAPWNKAVGLVLLFIAFFVSTRGGKAETNKLSRTWVKYVIASSVGNGLIGVTFKLFNSIASDEAANEFMFLSFGQAMLIALAIGAVLLWKNKGSLSHFKAWPFLLVVLGAAITTAGGNYLMVVLSMEVSALVQFPVINGALVITSIVTSRLVFKEQVTARHLQTIAVGLAAIVLLSV